VEALREQNDENFRLILIDAGSVDGTAEMVTSLLPGSIVVRGTGQWWWARSLQAGIAYMTRNAYPEESIVMIANDDTTFLPSFLANARKAIRDRPRTLLLACLINPATGDIDEIGANVNWRDLAVTPAREPDAINCFSTRGLFLRLADFQEIGGFRPTLLPHYLSDYEFTMRAARRRFHLLSDPTVGLFFDALETGDRGVIRGTPKAFLSRTFSKRNAGNPIAWTMFVMMRCPIRYVPVNLFRIWAGFLRSLAGSFGRVEAHGQ
jgi:GT2 family glycosyltransferase